MRIVKSSPSDLKAPKREPNGSVAGPKTGARQTLGELRELQRLAGAFIMRPLGRGNRAQIRWTDGRPTSDVVAEFIKPNDRLTSLERLELYNKQYWFRLVDCLYDDHPGLRAVLGEQKFSVLVREYIEHYPSRSFSLRNLPRNMEKFIREQPQLSGARLELAAQMARFEWAQVEAFDGQMKPPVVPDDLLGVDPAKLRLALQPYVTVLDLDYPLDDFVLAVKKREVLRNEASNAIEEEQKTTTRKRLAMPKKERSFVAVHRLNNSLYYKRLQLESYLLLTALRDGSTLAEACIKALDSADDESVNWPLQVRTWFEGWTTLGWFCKRT